jgi:hypothetical protein
MPKYTCWFPNCNYETNDRSKIDYHHVVPREINPKSKITIPLCKNHHALIYIPDSKAGQHSIQSIDSLEIKGIFESTIGKTIHYKNIEGNEFYFFPRTGEIWDI